MDRLPLTFSLPHNPPCSTPRLSFAALPAPAPPAEMVKGPTPAVRRPSVKKKTNSFLRFQADQFLRLSGRDKVRKGLLARARAAWGSRRGAAARS